MQPLISALNHPAFHLPKRIEGSSMTDYLQVQFRLYLDIIEQVEEPMVKELLQPIKSTLIHFCNAVTAAINAYLRGDPAAAYYIFESAIEPLKQFLVMDSYGGASADFIQQKPYFRMRKNTELLTDKKEIFHLPLSHRSKVNNQRYSIIGLPCLYLSNSIYVCWKELGEPELQNTYVSRFVQANPYLKILDLDFTPNRLQIQLESFYGAFFDKKESFHESYYNLWTGTLINWPLIVACSLQTRDSDQPFKQEYIIPQLLLQWVMRQRDIAGIRYFSNKTSVFPTTLFTKYSNYVFPPKDLTEEYCSQLRASFTITDPICSASLNLSSMNKDDNSEIYRPDNYFIDGDNGSRLIYSETIFGKMESAMRQFSTAYF